MTFDSLEISEESSRPVELYAFTGLAIPYYYTSSENDEVVDSITYVAEAIKRSNVTDGPSKRDTSFEITVPSSNDLVKLYLGVIPGARVKIEVSRYQRDDTPTPTVVRVFTGHVSRVTFVEDGAKAKIVSTPAIAGISRVCPRYGYQQQCNHVLYDARCQVSSTDPMYRALAQSVSTASGNILNVPGATAFPDGWFNSGRVSLSDETDHRVILSHVGSVLILSQPFAATPTEVTLYAGCGHVMGVCVSKFNNGTNFGGFAHMPTRDPYNEGIL